MAKVSTIGLDVAKQAFQLNGADAWGKVVRRAFNANLERIQQSDRPGIALRRPVRRNEAPGFLYVGAMDGAGFCSDDPSEVLPVVERAEVDLGSAFAGYDWGTVESHAGTSWRWLDDRKPESVLLVRLAPDQSYVVEVVIHTVRQDVALTSLRAMCDGTVVEDQTLSMETGQPVLTFCLPHSVTAGRSTPVRLGFKVECEAASADGRSMALSKLQICPQAKGHKRLSSGELVTLMTRWRRRKHSVLR